MKRINGQSSIYGTQIIFYDYSSVLCFLNDPVLRIEYRLSGARWCYKVLYTNYHINIIKPFQRSRDVFLLFYVASTLLTWFYDSDATTSIKSGMNGHLSITTDVPSASWSWSILIIQLIVICIIIALTTRSVPIGHRDTDPPIFSPLSLPFYLILSEPKENRITGRTMVHLNPPRGRT